MNVFSVNSLLKTSLVFKRTFNSKLIYVLFPGLCFLAAMVNVNAVELSPKKVDGLSFQAVKGTFSQRKNIKPLKRPFKSEGRFIYLPNKGLLWHTQKPVDSIKLFANDGVYKVDEAGKLQKEAQLDNDFFLALFAGDEEKLTKFFITEKVLHPEQNEQESTNLESSIHNCTLLTPVSNSLKTLFEKINLCMTSLESEGEMPSAIELIEPNGNNTIILLNLSPEKVSAKELTYFE